MLRDTVLLLTILACLFGGSGLAGERYSSEHGYFDVEDDTVGYIHYTCVDKDFMVQVPHDYMRRYVRNDLWNHGFMTLRWLRPMLGFYRSTYNASAHKRLCDYIDDFYMANYENRRTRNRFFFVDHINAERLELISDMYHLFALDARTPAVILDRLREMITEHIERATQYLDIRNPYKLNNHHAMLNRAVAYAVMRDSSFDPSGIYLETALDRFTGVMDHIFTKNGVTREHTPAYQLYNMTILLDMIETYRYFGLAEPAGLAERLEKQAFFLSQCYLPDGNLPPVGDGAYKPYRDKLKRVSGYLGALPDPVCGAVLCPVANLAVLRLDGEGPSPVHIFFTASYLSSTHKQMDDLSFTLFAGGRLLIDEMGFDDWLSNMRLIHTRTMRLPEAHNTVTCSRGSWDVARPGCCGIRKYFFDGEILSIKAEHNRISGARVERYMFLDGSDILFVVDRVGTESPREFRQIFHVPEDTEEEEGERAFSCGDDDFRMTVSNFNYRAAAQLRSARKVRGNTLVPSKAINIRMPVERAGDFITVLQFSSRPFRVEDVEVSISPEDMVSINYTREGASVRREFLMRAVDTDTLIHYARLER